MVNIANYSRVYLLSSKYLHTNYCQLEKKTYQKWLYHLPGMSSRGMAIAFKVTKIIPHAMKVFFLPNRFIGNIMMIEAGRDVMPVRNTFK